MKFFCIIFICIMLVGCQLGTLNDSDEISNENKIDLSSKEESEGNDTESLEISEADIAFSELIDENVSDIEYMVKTIYPKDLDIQREQTNYQDDIYSSGYSFSRFVEVMTSSELESDSESYRIENLLDTSLETAWVEGKEGDGVGENFTFMFNESIKLDLSSIEIFNGYLKNSNTWVENNRVENLELYINGELQYSLVLNDDMESQIFDIEPLAIEYGTTLTFEIASVYTGDKYQDTAITEINFYGQRMDSNDLVPLKQCTYKANLIIDEEELDILPFINTSSFTIKYHFGQVVNRNLIVTYLESLMNSEGIISYAINWSDDEICMLSVSNLEYGRYEFGLNNLEDEKGISFYQLGDYNYDSSGLFITIIKPGTIQCYSILDEDTRIIETVDTLMQVVLHDMNVDKKFIGNALCYPLDPWFDEYDTYVYTLGDDSVVIEADKRSEVHFNENAKWISDEYLWLFNCIYNTNGDVVMELGGDKTPLGITELNSKNEFAVIMSGYNESYDIVIYEANELTIVDEFSFPLTMATLGDVVGPPNRAMNIFWLSDGQLIFEGIEMDTYSYIPNIYIYNIIEDSLILLNEERNLCYCLNSEEVIINQYQDGYYIMNIETTSSHSLDVDSRRILNFVSSDDCLYYFDYNNLIEYNYKEHSKRNIVEANGSVLGIIDDEVYFYVY